MKIIFILTLFLLAACKSTSPVQSSENMNQQQMLNLINQARSKGCNCGDKYMLPVPDLKWSNTLAKAAQIHSNDMYSKKYFSHTSPNGKSTPRTRLQQANYNFAFTAENIAMGQTNVKDVVAGWLNSPSHCLNIMNPNFTEIGAAVKSNYWTQVFGTPKPKNNSYGYTNLINE